VAGMCLSFVGGHSCLADFLATPRRRPAVLAHHAVAADLHAHRVAIAALVARITLHLGLGAELPDVG
jgi:hypothetical protein